MPKKTKTEKISAVLLIKGFIEVKPSRDKKYRQFTCPNPEQWYWLGKTGILRVGVTPEGSRLLKAYGDGLAKEG